jgi:intracellular sulfur oxidation DsrE/DsrF family protein
MFMQFKRFSILFSLVFLTLMSSLTYASTPEILTVQHKNDIKVVYDINKNDMAAGIGKGLYYVRGLIEAYKNQKIPLKQVHISIVLHGAAGYWLVNDETYQAFTGNPFDENPNKKVISELLDYGVSVEMCHVTMKSYHWTASNLLPGVKMVFDAYTRMIDLQMQGYSYIKF